MTKSAIYIHVPWCRRRCPYCDFYFEIGKPNTNFVDSIISEWEYRHKDYKWPADTLYFGGGTPSLLSTKDLIRLIKYFSENSILKPTAEITLEANPEDINIEYAEGVFKSGINRISLGVQSFCDETLFFLGRKHTGSQAKQAISMLKAVGFANISTDIIIGINNAPEQSINNGIDYIVEQRMPHISSYLLTIENGTRFYKLIAQGKMAELNEDSQVNNFLLVQNRLRENGYTQYDVSSYALSGHFSEHNQVYWAGGEYLGLGPGAHSMRLTSEGTLRSHNKPDLLAWLKDPTAVQITELLDQKTSLLESLAFGLRNMAFGISPAVIAKRHQAEVPQSFFAIVNKHCENGWLEYTKDSICLTQKGSLFADAIMRDILDCAS